MRNYGDKYQMWENRQNTDWLNSITIAVRLFFENKGYLPNEIRMPASIFTQIWPGNNSYHGKIEIKDSAHVINLISGPNEKQGPHVIWLGPIFDD